MQRIVNIEEFYVTPGPKIVKEILSLGDYQARGTSVKADVSDWCIQDMYIFDNLIGQLNVLYPKYQVQELWSVVYRQGDYTQVHNHSGFDFSFVWYLDTCPHCSPLVFPDPEHPWMPPIHTIRPKVGNLVVFDGHDIHYVPPHTCNHERVCVSGNLVPLDSEDEEEYDDTYYGANTC
tara:strand:- start:138 stop:668 length:531 start_codon:yes stop_codon:yes gene_type:complete